MDGYTLFFVIALMGVVLYFFMIRPTQKQQKKQQEMMDSLEEGTRVMLSSGIYGTIRYLGQKQVVLEISPGVDLTVMRAAVRNVVASDDEEFEYSNEIQPQDAASEETDESFFATDDTQDNQEKN
ncbi:MAG: preprotein translocase subunit YajC [Propionibacteriaceae bacterium]|nr:preprotein translocase subunit YajC [Propionibacteriaceae bacterium]